jgi:hypothetical protein
MSDSQNRIIIPSSDSTSVMEEVAAIVSEMQATRDWYNSMIDDNTRRLNALLGGTSDEQAFSTDLPGIRKVKVEGMAVYERPVRIDSVGKEYPTDTRPFPAMRASSWNLPSDDDKLGGFNADAKLFGGVLGEYPEDYKGQLIERAVARAFEAYVSASAAAQPLASDVAKPLASIASKPLASIAAKSLASVAAKPLASDVAQLAASAAAQLEANADAEALKTAHVERFVCTVLQQMENEGAHPLEMAAAQRFAADVVDRKESGDAQLLEKPAEERFVNALLQQMESITAQPLQRAAAERFAIAVLQQLQSAAEQRSATTTIQRLEITAAQRIALALTIYRESAALQKTESVAALPLGSADKMQGDTSGDNQNRFGNFGAWIGAVFVCCTMFTDSSPRITLALLALAVAFSVVVAVCYYRSLKASSF